MTDARGAAAGPTGLVHAPAAQLHRTGPGHPERPARLAAARERLEASGLWSACERLELALDGDPARRAEIEAAIERVHAPGWSARVRAAVESLQGAQLARLDADTVVSAHSHEAALAAVEGGREALRRVLAGRWRNAFVLTRPPGHHAERERALGFCLFNTVAVLAREAQALGIERVAIVDWDVHHGNGTQHLFEEDASVFYASLHQWPLYPGTGSADERGRGAGEGATLNLPQEPGSGDAQWLGACEARLLPALEDFAPELVLVSAGFDAHADDPLAGCRVSTEGFARLSTRVRELADARCGGRLVSLLEGGYDLGALGASVEAHVAALQAG